MHLYLLQFHLPYLALAHLPDLDERPACSLYTTYLLHHVPRAGMVCFIYIPSDAASRKEFNGRVQGDGTQQRWTSAECYGETVEET